jgi:threonyl-tRNA synthetase
MDHREIGKRMDLLMFHPLSPGCPIWLPAGNFLYSTLSDKIRQLNKRNGYVEVRTPMLFKSDLFKMSGHMDHYRDNMYLIGDSEDESALKPMNCPCHMLIFKSKKWSYRELPYRIHDQGVLHRNETSGSLSGLIRVRSFCQDDGHLFVTKDQLIGEIQSIIKMVNQVYRVFDMPVRAMVSTRPESFMGDPLLWDHAESVLQEILKNNSMEFEIDAGAGAFYGPKIDFYIKDSSGREFQTATIQLDFQLPLKFDLSYQDASNELLAPIVIHRAIFGSFERFIAILLEHTQGKLPLWLAPIQGALIPINSRNEQFCRDLADKWNAVGGRFIVSDDNSPLAGKIKQAHEKLIPYSLVVGDREVQANQVAIRELKSSMSPDDFWQKHIANSLEFNFYDSQD